jgi:hypothetical protein
MSNNRQELSWYPCESCMKMSSKILMLTLSFENQQTHVSMLILSLDSWLANSPEMPNNRQELSWFPCESCLKMSSKILMLTLSFDNQQTCLSMSILSFDSWLASGPETPNNRQELSWYPCESCLKMSSKILMLALSFENHQTHVSMLILSLDSWLATRPKMTDSRQDLSEIIPSESQLKMSSGFTMVTLSFENQQDCLSMSILSLDSWLASSPKMSNKRQELSWYPCESCLKMSSRNINVDTQFWKPTSLSQHVGTESWLLTSKSFRYAT